MNRRAFIGTLTAGLLVALLAAEAQQAGKVYRVGYLSPTPVAERGSNPYFNIFRREMRQRGYVEGQNFVLEHRSVEGSPGRDSEVVGELVRLKVDVIVAVSQPVVQAAKQATRIIPSSCSASVIQYRQDSSRVSLGRVATSRASARFPRS